MSESLNRTGEEKRASILIKYRGLSVKKIQREAEKTILYLSKNKDKMIMMCVSNQETVGVVYVRELMSLGVKEDIKKLILVGGGRYTYSAQKMAENAENEMRNELIKTGKTKEEAQKTAKNFEIEMIPSSLPSFDIFKHRLVPKHEILSEEEKKAILEKYHAEPHQFPWIKMNDPVAIILGAKPGEIVKITRDSQTAGTYVSYRYVIK